MAYTKTAGYVKFVRGTEAAFNSLLIKNPDTLYFITDDNNSNLGSLYLGSQLIGGQATSLNDLLKVNIDEIVGGSVLVYDANIKDWVPTKLEDLNISNVSIMEGASADKAGSAGLVPAPEAGDQDKFLRGDGTWQTINNSGTNSTTAVYEITLTNDSDHIIAIENAVSDNPLANGDIAVVKVLIPNTNKYEHTAYVYDGEKWVAMDGNYRADNVYFDEDFIFTKAIGTVSIPSSGNTVVSAAGKNLQEFFASIFAEEEYPSTPTTNVTLNSDNIGTKEVGTKISVSYYFTPTSGDYPYGPASNGVSWSNYKATFNNETLNASSGTFSQVQVTDDTNLSITGSVDQSAGAIPLTNLGNEFADAQIPAKSWTGLTKGTLKGYRAWFCGYKNGDNALTDPTAITGEEIRNLGNSANGSWKSSMSISKMKQMYFAAPKGKGYKPSVKDAATTAPQTVLGPIIVKVKGANDYVTADAPDGIDYEVWYVANADAASGSATVNIGKA